jgi:Ca2+-binding RTX toxin-like protein
MATIRGTNSSDSLYGGSEADSIFGYDGNDTLKGGGGADLLDGGNGIDTIFYGDSTVGVTVDLAAGRGFGGTAQGDTYVSIENVYASNYNDTLTGNDASNELYGLDGNDLLRGGGGADRLDGGYGDDVLKGGGGADYLVGGSGNDTADYSESGQTGDGLGVVVDLAHNNATFGDAWGDTFSSIENLTGSAYDDFLYGNDVANVLRGNYGNDSLFGYGGTDVLDGGNGNDTLDGGTGADTMRGGAGNDAYYVDSASDVVNEVPGQGSDSLRSSVSYALSATAEIEFMSTTNQNSTVALNFTGNDFNQYMSGNEGDNVLNGLGGADNLDGRGGNDLLLGGEGDDLFFGGAGVDTMSGGGGADQFVYRLTSETGSAPGAFDVITDFDAAQGDRINVSGMDANWQVAGNQDWTFIGTGGPFTAAGQIAYATDGTNTYIIFNDDNNFGDAVAIQVSGGHTVDASWFIL